jgi:hydroxycarboxylate dehydrogenase B
MRIQAEPLTGLVTDTLTRAGAEPEHARICAEHLVGANLRGHDSHGVGMAVSYLRWIAEGRMFPNRHAKVAKDSLAVLVVDGQFGLGQVVAGEAMEIGIARALQTGVACVALRNSCHIGRIGAYGEQCAKAGLISTHYVNVVGHPPTVAPYGGREPRTITNPYCCTIPRADGRHITLDMATSVVSAGKLRVAYMAGQPAPPNALMDGQGQPTTDPAAFFAADPPGFLLPFGGYKGGGLQVMCELLGGALAGHWTTQPESDRHYGATVNNMLSIIINPDALGERAEYEAEASAMIDYIRSTTPADGFDEVQLPGDPERASMAARLADGVPIDDNTWRELAEAATSLGIDAARFAAD